MSRGMQTVSAAPYPRVHLPTSITRPPSLSLPVSQPLCVKYLMPEEEIRSPLSFPLLPPSSFSPSLPPHSLLPAWGLHAGCGTTFVAVAWLASSSLSVVDWTVQVWPAWCVPSLLSSSSSLIFPRQPLIFPHQPLIFPHPPPSSTSYPPPSSSALPLILLPHYVPPSYPPPLLCLCVSPQVGSMCTMVVTAVAEGCGQVTEDVRRLVSRGEGEDLPKTPKELAK